jgi:hypothetical protein
MSMIFSSEPLTILTKIIDKNSITSSNSKIGYCVTVYNKCGNNIKGLPKKMTVMIQVFY